MIADEHGRIVVVNERFCRILGIYSAPGAFFGTDCYQLAEYTKDLFRNPDVYEARMREIVETRAVVHGEQLELVNGTMLTRDFIPIFTNKKYKGHIWKLLDVTTSRAIEKRFETQRVFYEHILHNVPADIMVYDTEQRFVYINPVAVPDAEVRKTLIGRSEEDYCRLTGRPQEIADNRKKVFAELKTSMSGKEWEEGMIRPDGCTEYYLRKMCPVINKHGQVDIVIGYGVNITERKEIEQQITYSEKRYRDIFSYSQAWICSHDMDGHLMTMNPAGCRLLGFAENELVGRRMDDFIPAWSRQLFDEEYMSRICNEGKAEGIMSVVNREGKVVHLLYQNFQVNEPGGDPYVIGFAQNITERILAEDALKRSEEKYRGIIENMNLGMLELDAKERIVYANQRFSTMSGYDPDELLQKKVTDFFLQGENIRKISDQTTKKKYFVNNSSEVAVRTRRGDIRWWLISAMPLLSPDGRLKGSIGIHLDITKQKKLEQQLREAKLEAERSSQSKDIFLTNMSHEIRTPINAIMGLGKLLSKSKLDSQQKYYLSSIRTASESLLVIINDVLDFSKIDAGKITLETLGFDLKKLCTHAANMLTHKAEEKGLIFTYEIDKKIAQVLIGDPYRINQVLMNMLSNAIKFTERGSVQLKARLMNEMDGEQRIMMTISDTGIGMNDEFLAHLFDKFTQEDVTVARRFGGTGLGMSISKQLMELMGGALTVDSAKNEGTTVSLFFVFGIGSENDLHAKEEVLSDANMLNGKQILLVEDNEMNRLVAYTVLQQYGAEVTEAEDGVKAIQWMRQKKFDLVLMDIQMPELDGYEATRIIRNEISTTVPVIALTANAIIGEREKCLISGMSDFVSKPYEEEKMMNVIARWLNKDHAEQPADEHDDHIIVSEQPLYDLAKLNSIGGGNYDFIKQMISIFINDIPLSVIKIREAYDTGDFEAVKYLAHRIKPSILNMGISRIKVDIFQIEKLAERKEKSATLGMMIENVEAVTGQVIHQLRQDYSIQ